MASTKAKKKKSLSDVRLKSVPSRAQAADVVRGHVERNEKLKAAEYIIGLADERYKRVELTLETAEIYIFNYVKYLLNCGEYLLAAKILWPPSIFTAEPRSVRMIWEAIPAHAEILIQGAGSMGKSYTAAVWLLLDWLRDPEFTCIKVLSVTEEHAKRNVFAHIKNLHANACIKLPGDPKEKSIIVGTNEKQGIHLMTIPAGDDGKGRLRGFHPVPRAALHPIFGILTRIRVILDEAEEIPGGVWEDVNNILITKDGNEHIKIIAATNPKDRNSKFGVLIEPENGWPSVSIETSESWVTKQLMYAIRLDGSKCENVEQRKIVFPGLLTWDGYQKYIRLGDKSLEYYTMARGWFPEQGLTVNVVPADLLESCIGQFKFYGKTTYCAGCDLAFEGGDKAVMTIGRFGRLAQGGKFGLEILNQFQLAHRKTDEMSDEIIRICKNFSITADWLAVDRTGNGTGVHDMLCTKMKGDVMGMMFGEGSTDTRILSDDSQMCSELYKGLVTEVWFALRKWMEFGFLKFAPTCDMSILRNETASRRYGTAGMLVKVESKKEYKARGFNSPDHGDSLSVLLHLIRMRSDNFEAYMLKPRSELDADDVAQMGKGIVDELRFVDFDEKQ